MSKCLFFFDANGKKINTIRDVGSVVNDCGKFLNVYGIDSTKIGCFDIAFCTWETIETDEPESIRTLEDLHNLEKLREEQRWTATRESIQETLDYFTKRHTQLLDLIEYAEMELASSQKFTPKWERLQKKVMSLEKQLRQNDTKRDKAYKLVYGF